MDFLYIIVVVAILAVLIVLMIGLGGFTTGGNFNRKYANKLMRWRIILTVSNASFSGTPPAIDATNIPGTAANLTPANATLTATSTHANTAHTVTTISTLTGAVTSNESSNATTLSKNRV